MRTAVVSVAVMMAALLPLLSCRSPSELTDEQLARCLAVSNELGSVGGSDQIISLAAVQLSDDAIAPAGSSDEEIEATFDRAFLSLYGIHVDDFLSIRRSADAATTERLGDPPGVGELVAADDWFNDRDAILLDSWNDRYPGSARTFCELVDTKTTDES